MEAFKLVTWSGGYGRSERVVYAPSYNAASNTYLSCLPAGTIATLEPL